MKTTREAAKEETHKELVNNLQELLVKNYDANKGFKKAIKEAKDHELKEFFKIQAFQHHRYATQLDKLIHSLNHTPIEEGSTVGRFHRIWMDVLKTISGNDDKTIFEECKRGQTATMKEYREKLRNNKFPLEIKDLLKKHLLELETSLDENKAIKELNKI